ncbi:MAG TPA: amino acid adenylation domain-containing protein, partial [Thermoanaerobaculia bacterium]|nr:amino acid adenylation domain-containing protein [Thermoanaerobaculia bacterium]
MAHCLTWAHAYGMTAEDRVLQFASASFDASVEQIFAALLSGATLVMRGPELWGTRELPRRITELGLTLADLPTAFWNRWVRDLEDVEDVPGRLRLVGIGGEELLAESARLWNRSPLARVRLLNSYGPTEAVVSATLYEVPPGDGESGPVPIGRPLPGRVARVLDRSGQPQPMGIPGELCVGGPLARGYLGRPDLTAAAFVPDLYAETPGARLYRTGDLVRRRPDGQIEFLGRTDDQVKVRGFRIEPGEIEAALAEHPEVREAAVLAVPGPGGERRLVGFVAPERPADLTVFLRQRLPDYMVPAAWAMLPSLPINASGKVDRAALRRLAVEVEAGAEEGGASPRTPEEELLAGIFAELLGRERVGAHDDFFALGGHSLLATRLVSRISRVFGVDLPVSAVFQEPTVVRLAARIAAGRAETAPPIRPVPRRPGEPLPLSFAQRRLWFLDQLEPGSAIYNVPGSVCLVGLLDVPALVVAVAEIARRHEILRTVFPVQAGEPAQIVQPVVPALPVIDLAGLPEAARKAEAERRVRQEAARPFDLARGPVCRVALVRIATEEHLLLVTLHHIASDGWSLGLFLDELTALYGGAALPALPVQYADYAVWQAERLRGEGLERQLSWWRDRLAGLPVLELPADHPRPSTRDPRGASRSLELPAELGEAVARLARSRGVTLFMALLGAFQALLARYTGEGVIPVGSPVAHRDRPEIEPLIGLFVNTLVLTARVDDDPSVAELLARVREASLGAYAHQEIPFERLVEELAPSRDLSRNPLFQVMFVLEEPLPARQAGGLLLEPVRSDSGAAKFDLLLSVTPEPGGGLRVATEHAAALFEAPTMDRLLGHWAALLAGAAADPGRRLSELPLLGAAERAQILTEWNDSGRTWPEGLRLHDLVRAQAERTPEAEAVVGEAERITYRELTVRSSRIARLLRRLGVGPERRVGICLRRTPDMIAVILGVLEAGGAYVPLDPAYPVERIELMYRDSGAGVLLTETAVADRVGFGAGIVLLDSVDFSVGEGVSPSPTLDSEDSDPRNLAYVIYTSGSTGRPKGVPIEHRSAVSLVLWALELFPREDLAGVLAATSIAFDLSVFEIFVPLSAGGKVILAGNVLELPQLAAIHEVTLVNGVPSPVAELVRGRLPVGLRTVNLAGEALPADLAERLYAHPQIQRVYNLYGPTEDTTYSTGSLVPRGPRGTTVPAIGRPLFNSRAYVLGRHGEPVPIGVVGELYLGGDGLARGYLDRSELTAERFVPDSFGDGDRLYRTGDRARLRPDGEIEYLGRADFQVKISGIRIELGEIESTLAGHPAVRGAVVVARADGPGGGPRLVAYVVGEAGHDELAAWLRERLPAAMVPSAWVEMPALPLTPNGKVDRKRLPAPDWGGRTGETAAPRTPAEEKVAAAFREALGVERVGAFDSFFELGGHSLLAVRAAFRLAEAFGVEVPVSTLFQAPMVAALAEKLTGVPARPDERVRAEGPGPFPLSLAQRRLWFLNQLEPGDSAYHLWVPVRLGGELAVEPLRRSLAEIVRRHEPLRTVYGEV